MAVAAAVMMVMRMALRQLLVTGSDDCTARVWSLATGSCLKVRARVCVCVRARVRACVRARARVRARHIVIASRNHESFHYPSPGVTASRPLPGPSKRFSAVHTTVCSRPYRLLVLRVWSLAAGSCL